jgi:inorganic pyrophosphatase
VTTRNSKALLEVMKVMFKPHPWHGISMGDRAPEIVTCYIEIVPTDSVKYEIEKTIGYLKVDRPQRFSSFSPLPLRFDSAHLLRCPGGSFLSRKGEASVFGR